jgi:hypothetical protein
MVLLQCSVSHGLVTATRKLLELSMGYAEQQGRATSHSPSTLGNMSCVVAADHASHQGSSGDLLGRAELHELLLCCAGLNLEQLQGRFWLKLELFGCLLSRAGLYGFDGASLCMLGVALTKGFPCDHFTWYRIKSWATNGGATDCAVIHPVEQLLKLAEPAVVSADVICTVAGACIAAGFLLESVLDLPAAAQLSVDHIRQLADACVLQRNGDALRLILKHPAAPGPDDPQVQFCRGLLCHQ